MLSRVAVDLDAVRHNFAHLCHGYGYSILAVVKADAYGHGAIEVAQTLTSEVGLYGFAVARLEEAIRLRRRLGDRPILLFSSELGGAPAPKRREVLDLIVEHQITPVVSSRPELDVLIEDTVERGPAIGSPLSVHIEIDTGMSRAGLSLSELESALSVLRASPMLHLGGLLSHLSESEKGETEQTRLQFQRFEEALSLLTEVERAQASIHLANSAAALHLSPMRRRLHQPPARDHVVRSGGALYGIDLGELGNSPLRPAMTVTSRAVAIRRIDKGTQVGYGGQWVAQRPSDIALVPIGYADGYPTQVQGATALLPSGRAPVVGTVSMDLLTLDVTDCQARTGDTVVLLGSLRGREITVFDLAQWSGRLPYEITCSFSRRLPREFTGDGGPRPPS